MLGFKEFISLNEMSNNPKDKTGIDYPIWVGYNNGKH